MIFDHKICALGEGPMWHPIRQEFFWFDILGKAFHSQKASWQFDEYVSAAGWINDTSVLMATQSALCVFDIESGSSTKVVGLEEDNPVTRSNDGRADPYGGFWIGTMGIGLEPGEGAIYRYYRGELRRLYANITVSNAICFSPDGGHAYFTDTGTHKIMVVALEGAHGWPIGAPKVAVDLSAEALRPDGCVVDAHGQLWNAQWGSARVACYRPDGTFVTALPVGGAQSSCPAFGGAELDQMIVTTAAEGLSPAQLAERPASGKTFLVEPGVKGQAEHQVIL